ncbi:hypothetical protein SVIOM342S_01055 [Streptomyces violaceorubidus]
MRKCGSYDARQLNIQTIDPKSGKVLSEYKMAKGIEYAGVVSTDPLVVAADVGDSAEYDAALSRPAVRGSPAASPRLRAVVRRPRCGQSCRWGDGGGWAQRHPVSAGPRDPPPRPHPRRATG